MPPDSPSVRGLRPGPPIEGVLRAPGSKSLAQRALLCAALAEGRSELVGLPAGHDVLAARGLVEACGAVLQPLPDERLAVLGCAGRPVVAGALDVGESGTLARLALAALAVNCAPGSELELRASGSLARRASPALWAALAEGGVQVLASDWPWRLRAAAASREYTLRDPGSSQELSGLLLALAACGGGSVLVRGALPSRPYADMTCALLERFGARGSSQAEPGGSRWSVVGPLRAPAQPLVIEPDASTAAVALAAGCISGGSVLALGLSADSAQGDVRIGEHLAAFGCRVEWDPDGLRASGLPTRTAELDLSGEPDLAPVLAAVAAAAAPGPGRAPAWSRLSGLETLARKESSRIEVLADGLQRAGWACEQGPAELRIGPRQADDASACLLAAHGDHRMVFAFALLGLLRAQLRVSGASSVAKSWPDFWEDLAALGARSAPDA